MHKNDGALFVPSAAAAKEKARQGMSALAEPQEQSTSISIGSRLVRSCSTNTILRLRLARFSRPSSSLRAAMASSLSSAQIQPQSSPPAPGLAQSTEADVTLQHLQLPPIEPLPPLTIPTPFLPLSETIAPVIPVRVRPPLSVLSMPDDDAKDWKTMASARQHSSGSLRRERPPSVYDHPLSPGIATGQSENFIAAPAITPRRSRRSSATSGSHSFLSNSSPSSSPLPSPSSISEVPLTSSSPISDTSSTASGSSTRKYHHRRNPAILKNSISVNYTPVLPARASVRRSYYNTSVDSIQAIQRPLGNVSGEEALQSDGVDESHLGRAKTADAEIVKPSETPEDEPQSSSQQQQIRLVKSSSIRIYEGPGENDLPDVPIFLERPTISSSRTFSRLGLGLRLSRMSRSSPDLRSQYQAGLPSQGDTIPLPDIPVRPATSNSAASTSDSSTSSVAKPHTLKSYKSLPRLKNFAKKAGVTAANVANAPRRASRSASPLHHFGMGLGGPLQDTTIALVPPLPEKFLQKSESNVDGAAWQVFATGTANHDTSPWQGPSSSAHTPKNSTTPALAAEQLPSPPANDSVVSVERPKEESPATPTNATIQRIDSEVFYTARSTLANSPQSTRPASPATVKTAKVPISASTEAILVEAPSTPNAVDDSELKSKWKRIRLIRELVDTEIAYLSDLKVIEKYYRASALRQTFITKGDVLEIFGNLSAILEFTQEFCISLRSAGASAMRHGNGQEEKVEDASVLDEQESFVGDTFIQAIPQLEKVYKVYCHSHEFSIQRLHRLATNNPTQMARWLDACRQASVSRTNAWSLESLLIKPVQRLMKYPLLLKFLAECTPVSHPDKISLDKAAIDIQRVADRTNEEKGRTDFPTSGPADITELRKGVTKGLVRSTEKLRQTVANSDRHEFIDRSYDILVDRFRRRHMELRIVVESFNSCFQVCASSIEKLFTLASSFDEWAKLPVAKISASSSGSGTVPYPEIEAQWRSFRRTITDLHDHDLNLFRSAFVSHVISPLEHVLDLFDRPLKAMSKRNRKAADYRRYLGLRERGVVPDKTVVALAESYLALNGTLIKEIPKFLDLVDEMVQAVLKNWVDVQAQWYINCTRRIREYCTKNFADMPYRESTSIEDLETTFLMQFSALDGVLKSHGIFNGDLHQFLQALDSEADIPGMYSSRSLESVHSPVISSGGFGSKRGNSTPKLKSNGIGDRTPPLPSHGWVRSVSSSSSASQCLTTVSDSAMRSDAASKKRSALTSPSVASLVSAPHKSRPGRNLH
ncbi:hypothetical protein V1525DRAFT_372929 [Lipomyces kononenkoae]|uniref:Uncharacterized protein n=1 Tax=Lipomyces kononenkoae TaxID=34357 RepID=A0ACC3T5X2_LIPKO